MGRHDESCPSLPHRACCRDEITSLECFVDQEMLNVVSIPFPGGDSVCSVATGSRTGRERGAEWSGKRGGPAPLPSPLILQSPAEDKIHGILLGFRIRYRELLYDGLRGFTLRGINNPAAKWAELTCE